MLQRGRHLLYTLLLSSLSLTLDGWVGGGVALGEELSLRPTARRGPGSGNLRKAGIQHDPAAGWSPEMLLECHVGPRICSRLRQHLAPWLQSSKGLLTAADVVKSLLDGEVEGDTSAMAGVKSRPVLLVSLGNTETFKQLTEEAWARPPPNASEPESYGVLWLRRGHLSVVAAGGQPIDAHWSARTNVATGAAYAAYAVLHDLGFAFLHPLQLVVPERLVEPQEGAHAQWETPRWRSRALHVHTQHPLELTDVLQGFDIPLAMTRGQHGGSALEAVERIADGYGGTGDGDHVGEAGGHGVVKRRECKEDVAAGVYCEYWEDMLQDVEQFFEWLVAHRFNRVEWILLGNPKWGPLVESPLRQRRLRVLARMAQSFGLMVGLDFPIALRQQHTWIMTSTLGSKAKMLQAVRDRVDWIIGAGFDFVSTESGLSEFTHPRDDLMLDLLNEFAERVNGTWGKEATVKVHCSTKQVCRNYPDPRTGQPLNFNFLPTYASGRLGVLPHTVQAYALDQQSAGAYGNQNFSYMLEYMLYEASLGNRSVHFYPETAYWVNVDIDVPLFLPIYAERRIHDLQLLAREEDRRDLRLSGVLNFHSGFEWGYWLNDIILAAASWNPTQWMGESTSSSFRRAVIHALRPLDLTVRQRVADWLARLVTFQNDVLLKGEIDGEPCPDLTKLSGIAYLMGQDTWSCDVPRMLGLHMTQPDRVLFRAHKDPAYPYVERLLSHMRHRLAEFDHEGQAVVQELEERSDVSDGMLAHLREMRDGVTMQALRAKHVSLLYAAAAPEVTIREKRALEAQSRSVIYEAAEVVREREQHYRVPVERIAAWSEGPTAYGFGYLWPVSSLYYMWRDQGQVEAKTRAARLSPCYLNRHDPTEVAIGYGKKVLSRVRERTSSSLLGHLMNCVAPPQQEFVFPRDL